MKVSINTWFWFSYSQSFLPYVGHLTSITDEKVKLHKRLKSKHIGEKKAQISTTTQAG